MKQVFLDNYPLEDVQRKYREVLERAGALERAACENVSIHSAAGRITCRAARAKICSPHYHASAMDGFAVRSEDTFGASEVSPHRLNIGAEAVVVDTGDPLPPGFDAVIRVEDVSFPLQEQIEIIAGAVPWQHVRVMGEDLVATEMLLPANHRIRSVDIAVLYAGGLTEVAVRKRPIVAVLPTGTELVEPGTELQNGSIIEFNSRMLAGMIEELGAEALRFPITEDNYELLRHRATEALSQADLVIINAGSSAGREDFTARLIGELGEVITHGVAIKPGKPVVLGLAGSKPIIGLPGYPVSAALTFELFTTPIIAAKLGVIPLEQEVEAVLTRKLVSPLGVDEFVRVKLGNVGEKLTATPLARGAGMVSSLVRADGVVQVERLSEGVHPGQTVKVRLLRQLQEIAQTIVAIGSHDPAMDILGDLLHSSNSACYLSSAHVGSLGGLLALRRGEAHLAGIHLLDEASGKYNRSYVAKLLDGCPAVLVNMAYRVQGLMVAPGNPKRIEGLQDLLREDVAFINRQSGSGTRVLLDYRLKQEGIDPASIRGYSREEFTHMAVAAVVSGGSADCGLGVWSAAQALGLAFIPVAEERFDLCILERFLDLPHMQALLQVLQSGEFHTQVEALGGYDLRDCGKFID